LDVDKLRDRFADEKHSNFEFVTVGIYSRSLQQMHFARHVAGSADADSLHTRNDPRGTLPTSS